MRILFIGGSGTISAAISRQVLSDGHELLLLNRGNRNTLFTAAHDPAVRKRSGALREVICDINNEADADAKLQGLTFDVVVDFIAFTPDQVERDFRLFNGRTNQYITLSSASAYQKPLSHYQITEGTPLANPYWEYARNKIACEEYLAMAYREEGFPITIVRPSQTYDERSVPLGIHGRNGSWQVLQRMREGKPVIIHGDGTSLWTVTHADDFAAAFTGLLGNIHAIGEAVHITSDETLTWNQIYETIAHALDVELKAVHVSSEFLGQCDGYNFWGGLLGDKANSVVFDNAKLKRLVPDFVPRIRFDQGVQETVHTILCHPEFQKSDPEFDEWCDRVIAARTWAVQWINGAEPLDAYAYDAPDHHYASPARYEPAPEYDAPPRAWPRYPPPARYEPDRAAYPPTARYEPEPPPRRQRPQPAAPVIDEPDYPDAYTGGAYAGDDYPEAPGADAPPARRSRARPAPINTGDDTPPPPKRAVRRKKSEA